MMAPISRRCFLATSALATLAGCLPSGEYKRRFSVVPEKLDDGFEIDTPEAVGLDLKALEAMHEELLREDRQRGVLGMLVIKDGRLVWETYLRDPKDRDLYHHLQSATKSVTSLAFGIARDEGLFTSVDLTLEDLIPEKLTGRARDKAKIRIRDLLTMRSGIAFDNDVFSVEMWVDRPSDPLKYILDKPMYAKPGERFYYRDADAQVTGCLLQHAVGRSEREYVDEKLFKPLRIRDYHWETGPAGVSLAAHGLHLKPRDFAKIGQLMLDGGAHRGKQLVSREWCELATTEHVRAGLDTTDHRELGYGYYFWTVHGTDRYACWGHGGQFVLACPEQNLVLVRVALPDTGDLDGTTLPEFLELVAPVIASA